MHANVAFYRDKSLVGVKDCMIKSGENWSILQSSVLSVNGGTQQEFSCISVFLEQL